MADSIPAVLSQLAQAGISIGWRDGKAVFSAPTEPPSETVALIDSRKGEISAFLRPDVVQRRFEAETDLLQAPRPPDVNDSAWQAALRGLKAFIANGHGDEALRLGWPRDELYAVPPIWSRVDLCGVGLLIGDGVVVEITSTRIGVRTSSDAPQAFYKRPEFDIALAYSARIKSIGLDAAKEEPRLRAVEAVVLSYQAHHRCDFETAKAKVLAAIKGEAR
jgi:hypothetical protein